ncbi:MAG: pyridoxal phosphate-dependent aminotransferase [Deltaproteobacteria bacterium]|jgi:aspartate aminotransferase|nr:pyridoxal phosphate-dependent aminotransferase [Deltaproteobacteria bacterium]
MPRLAELTNVIHPSPTLFLDAQVKALKARGVNGINLGVGEPDFPTPGHIVKAAEEALRAGFTKYTASEGILELREAVAGKLAAERGLEYGAGQIVVGSGGKHALCNAMFCLFGQGDEVIIPGPAWVTYPELVRICGAEPVMVETRREDGYILKAGALERALSPRTRGLIINSPNNPTGMVYGRADLEALVGVIEAADLWVISDDIYEKLIYDGREFWNLPMVAPRTAERTVIIGGVSKTYAMTGWRIGYLAGPEPVARAAAKLQSQMTSNPNSLAQKAAVAALTGPQDEARAMAAVFGRRRETVVGLLREMPGVECLEPAGAFYVFPDVSAHFGRTLGGVTIKGSDDLASVLLKECLVATVPGSGFGEDRALRLSYAAAQSDIEEGLRRMTAFLA